MVELVWDGRDSGTIVAPSGATLDAGPDAALSPLDLLAAAAASCLMRAFLPLMVEAGIELLGFVSASSVDLSGVAPRVRIHLLLTVPRQTPPQDRRIPRLIQRARRESPVCQALGRRVFLAADIRHLATR